MSKELEDFKSLLRSCQEVNQLYSYYSDLPNPMDISDLMRWELTQAVSALDKYIHDVVRHGMLKEKSGTNILTKQFKNITLTMEDLISLENSDDEINTFEIIILRMHGYKSFQSPKTIKSALALIWDNGNEDKFLCISQQMGIEKSMVEQTLSLISQRRNSIVHQGDYFNLNIGERSEIQQSWVSDSVSFIEKFCESLDKCLLTRNLI
ncbi:HEPN domain-containing protein [Lactiplantibacillus pentosus]|uniref:HEPN domain-containing protein n=1 Tax=Lactiplantibacillus pentosus TaxID=1589 RepID=UPI00259B0B6E|nr:HEPN domain-containing protein [Lactiplantibacillus pentosus]WFC03228.1 HEPN domain-containing protein [Lactiplantibacillus pentosus]